MDDTKLETMNRHSFLNFLILVILCQLCWSADPVVSLSPSGPVDVQINNTVLISATGTDPDAQVLSFFWNLTSVPSGVTTPTLSINRVSLETSTASFVPTTPGAYVLQVVVDDADGNPLNVASANVLINAVENRNIYVQLGGNDLLTRLQVTSTTPLANLSRAIQISEPGDSILLMHSLGRAPEQPTTWALKEVIWNKSGVANRPITLRGEDAEFIHIRPQAASDEFAFRISNSAFVNVEGLKFFGFTQKHAVEITGSNQIRLNSSAFTGNRTAIYLDEVGQLQITNNLFAQNQSGVQMGASTDTALALNTFFKNQLYGIFLEPNKATTKNRISNNTFYGNGTTWAPPVRHAAINNSVTFEPANQSDQNSFLSNLYVNNIKDWFAERFSHVIDFSLSFANVEPQADPRFAYVSQTTVWRTQDPLLLDPEVGNFTPINGSLVIGQGFGGTNIGAFQGLSVTQPATGVFFVDQSLQGSGNCGNESNPCASLNRALELAPKGAKIQIRSTRSIVPTAPPPHYKLDMTRLKSTGPGWATVTIEGLGEPARIDCNLNQDAILIQNQSFLNLKNLYLTDSLSNDGSSLTSSCDRAGLHISNSRHINIDSVIIQGHRTGVLVHASDAIKITSSVLFLNSSDGIHIHATQNQNLLYPLYSHQIFMDKLTLRDNTINSISVVHSISSSITNSIFSASQTCVLTSPGITRNLTVKFSLCDKTALTTEAFLVTQEGNLASINQSTRPLFRNTSPVQLRLNPRTALLLAYDPVIGASVGLNSADPSFTPSSAILPEFANVATITSLANLPIPRGKTAPGRMDMGAFEQSMSDVDGDGIPNVVESSAFLGGNLNANNPADAELDFDGDGLDNLFELSQNATCIATPAVPGATECTKPVDTDLDGFTDFEEFLIGSNPLLDDSALIIANLPKPIIDPHQTTGPPGRYELNAREGKGRTPTNLWQICSIPNQTFSPCITASEYTANREQIQSKIQFIPTFRTMTFSARIPGSYIFAVDQTVLGGTDFTGQLVSLPADRAFTTFVVQDVTPTPILPASRSVLGVNGRSEHFYGFLLAENPSFDANGQGITYEWLLQTANQDCTITDSAAANPTLFLKAGSYTCEYRLKVNQIGGLALSAISTEVFAITVQSQAEPVFVQLPKELNTSTQVILTLDSKPSSTTTSVFWEGLSGSVPQFVTQSGIPVSTGTFTGNPAFVRFLEPGVSVIRARGVDSAGKFSPYSESSILVDDILLKVPEANISGIPLAKTSDLVRLNGSKSRLRDGSSINSGLTYLWKQVSGPPLPLSTSNTFLEFRAIDPGVYTFSLEVVSATGLKSRPALHQILIEDRLKSPLEAKVSSLKRTFVGRTFVLSGFQSTPQDCSSLQTILQEPGLEVFEFVCTPIFQWNWRQISGPGPARFLNTGAPEISIVARTGGTYSFGLTVSNQNQKSLEAVSVISIDSDSQRIPYASAGSNRSVATGELALLDGRGSYDPDGDGLSFQWRQISGLPVTLENSTSSQASFIPQTSGLYTFELTVFDGSDFSPPSTVLVSVLGPEDPTFSRPHPASSFPSSVTDENFLKTAAQGNSSGCFVVTASFSANSFPVLFFQTIRDRMLIKTAWGELLIQSYYEFSPYLAAMLKQSLTLRCLMQVFLWAIILALVLLPAVASLMFLRMCVSGLR